MPKDNKYNQEIENEGESGQGSFGGQIEYHGFLGDNTPMRDDLLSADEQKRRLLTHKDGHEDRVKKQRDLKEQREAAKTGKHSPTAYERGLRGGGGMQSQFPNHPVLSNTAQFGSGVDKQTNPVPAEYNAQTQEKESADKQEEYRLTNTPKNTPASRPKYEPPKMRPGGL